MVCQHRFASRRGEGGVESGLALHSHFSPSCSAYNCFRITGAGGKSPAKTGGLETTVVGDGEPLRVCEEERDMEVASSGNGLGW